MKRTVNRPKYKTVTTKKCPICGKEFKSRGLAGHLAHAHNVKEVVREVLKSSERVVNTSVPMPGMPEAPRVVDKQVTERVSMYVQKDDNKICWHCKAEMNLKDTRLPHGYGPVGWCPKCGKAMSTRSAYLERYSR